MIVLKVVIFRLAHGHSCENMANCFNVGASTIMKYMKIIVSVIVQKLF
jgi:transposase